MCPYANQPIENWSKVTDELIKNFPLEMKEIVDEGINTSRSHSGKTRFSG